MAAAAEARSEASSEGAANGDGVAPTGKFACDFKGCGRVFTQVITCKGAKERRSIAYLQGQKEVKVAPWRTKMEENVTETENRWQRWLHRPGVS